jgi:hexulose-6-phosphate isomerase
MKRVIKIAGNESEFPIGAIAQRAAAAGFAGLELTLESAGPLSFNSSEEQCRSLRSTIEMAGLKVSGLGLRIEAIQPVADSGSSPTQFSARIVAALDRACWLGAQLLRVPLWAHRDCDVPYADSVHLAVDLFCDLRFEAQRRAVRLAISAEREHFQPTPLELRRLLDDINSPWVTSSVNFSDVISNLGRKEWIHSLGHRLARIEIGSDTKEAHGMRCTIDWGPIIQDLHAIRFAGLMVCNRASLATPD